MRFSDLYPVNGHRSGHTPPEEWIHINFFDGGLGDHVCRLPAIKYIVDEYPFVNLTVWCPKFFLDFAKKAIPNVNWRESKNPSSGRSSQPVINAGSIDGVTSLRTHLVDHAFMRIVDKVVPNERKNYIKVDHTDVDLSNFNLPEKYVVVTTGYTAKVREMVPSVVNTISNFIISKGYTPVFLGSRTVVVGTGVQPITGKFSNEINFTKGLDLRDKTNLIEAHAIIAKSKCIVGLDNGLLHIAGCTDIPIVAGFTIVEAAIRLPYRNNQLGWNCYSVEPETSLECRFCQSKMNFVYNFSFTKCYYKENKLDDKIRCTEEASAEPYINHLEKLL